MMMRCLITMLRMCTMSSPYVELVLMRMATCCWCGLGVHMCDADGMHVHVHPLSQTETEDSTTGGNTAGAPDDSYDVDGDEDVEDQTRNQRVGDD